MTSRYCDSRCQISRGGAGPWDDQHENFSNIRQAHKNCPGFQIGTRNLKGKENWGHTEIEKAFTDCLISNWDECLHIVTASVKDSNKICLISQRFKK